MLNLVNSLFSTIILIFLSYLIYSNHFLTFKKIHLLIYKIIHNHFQYLIIQHFKFFLLKPFFIRIFAS